MAPELYLGALSTACVLGLWIAYSAWTNRKTSGALTLSAMALASTVWAAGTIGLVLTTTPVLELRLLQASYLGIVAAPITFFLFAVQYTGIHESPPRTAIAGLVGAGFMFLALVWTNPVHHLYWSVVTYAVTVPEGISTTPGPGFWAFVVFTYALLFAGSVLLIRYAIRAPHLYTLQIGAILLAVAAPWAANIPHSLQLMTADLTPVALSVTTAALWTAMFRYRLTDIGPVALRTVFENIAPGVYVLDHNERIVDYNAAGIELFDVDEDPVGTHFRTIVPEELYESVQDDGDQRDVVAIDSSSQEKTQYYETRVAEIEATVGHGGTVIVITDITARQQQRKQLEQQNQRLDEFASVISHDLRNPMQVATGRLELARDDCDSPHLEHVATAMERMDALIDDVLTLARHGEEAQTLEPVDIARFVEKCWRTVETADATLEIDCDRRVVADRTQLRQLFENLLTNAVAHGGDSVTVTVGPVTDGFYVADDGVGLPEDASDEVFDAGYTTAPDGTGLGLAIVKEVADAHNWDIHMADSATGGARFEFTNVE